MAFWRTYYHLVWATWKRQPLITPPRESDLYSYIFGKSDTLGCILHAIGGIENHIHLVVSIPPKLSVAEFVKAAKGSSAHHINGQGTATDLPLKWQRGYGVFTLGGKQLDEAKAYVERQKEHHAQGTLIPALERLQDEEDAR
ncbi:MAG: IS200/IS605 family transposase [Spirulinaceae cyanobacterium SM2_1_0]|nr:IS200/IS605 family transposase [Spirulinaceae cyanobacterium SM2_1_0]